MAEHQNPRIGDLIRLRRKDLGHSQEAASSIMGVTQSLVSRLERGLADPFPRRQIVADYLGQPVEAVLQVMTAEISGGDIEGQLADMVLTLRGLTDQVGALRSVVEHLDRLVLKEDAEQADEHSAGV